jgi:hypothetical protein
MAAYHEQPFSEDEVPTLNDLIFPGNPEKIKQKTMPAPSVKDQINALPREGIQTIKPKPKKNSLEKMIAEHIEFILQKHMAVAREEITRVIMAELRSRLPGGKKTD